MNTFSACGNTRQRQRGFTLIELMVTVAIVGLLTIIALPAYSSYTLRTNRAVGKSALVSMAAAQETYFVDRKTYTSTLSDLGLAAYLSRDGSTAATQTSNSIYQLSSAALTTNGTCPATGSATSAGYTLIAAPVGSQARDTACATLCLTSSGIRLASAGTAANCWSR
ncbi:type IV pilin protein [Hydrocarboniphaga sp.]|uniref:type IV pilin protein n=1 Tax=Hydrocarboniphaga sp. TaxID=2033016 RepID=UPI003D143C20